ncbi:MAG: SDR family NAD(P)-dependent oxidoreductase [Sphingomonadaceae bacterium]
MNRIKSDGGAGRLAGRVLIVTGAASEAGIGFASARRCAAEGATLILTDLDKDKVEARAASLRAEGFVAEGHAQDVTSEQGWDQLISVVVNHHGRIDGLVNNAGIVVLAPVQDLAMDAWERQINVNLTSVFLGCRAVIRQMRQQGQGGSIVNISSTAGLVGMPRTTAYAASKGGVRLMSKALAIEWAAEGIRVNSVHPGVIETEIQNTARSGAAPESITIANSIPMRHTGRAGHVADAVAFLLSTDADYVTGTELVVDGGLTAQ